MSEATTDERTMIRWRALATAYVWGRQDAGESERDSGASFVFGEVYGTAMAVTDGYAGPVQGLYHQWRETGRVVVRDPRYRGRVVQVAATGAEGAVQVLPIPWAGDGWGLPYWPGIVREPAVPTILVFDEEAVGALRARLNRYHADGTLRTLRVIATGDGVKYKVNEGTWSLRVGATEVRG